MRFIYSFMYVTFKVAHAISYAGYWLLTLAAVLSTVVVATMAPDVAIAASDVVAQRMGSVAGLAAGLAAAGGVIIVAAFAAVGAVGVSKLLQLLMQRGAAHFEECATRTFVEQKMLELPLQSHPKNVRVVVKHDAAPAVSA